MRSTGFASALRITSIHCPVPCTCHFPFDTEAITPSRSPKTCVPLLAHRPLPSMLALRS
jgi:hypothetical protein